MDSSVKSVITLVEKGKFCANHKMLYNSDGDCEDCIFNKPKWSPNSVKYGFGSHPQKNDPAIILWRIIIISGIIGILVYIGQNWSN